LVAEPVRCTILSVLAIFALGACSSEDACEKQASKLESCGIHDTGTPRECQGKLEKCVAECTNDATCKDIIDAATAGEYENCLLGCVDE
jgi:hypothetical protein